MCYVNALSRFPTSSPRREIDGAKVSSRVAIENREDATEAKGGGVALS